MDIRNITRCNAFGLFFCVLVFLASCVSGHSVADELQVLEREFYSWRLKTSPEMATDVGVHTYDNLVDDFSLASQDAMKAKVDEFLTRLGLLNRDGLTWSEKLHYDIFNDTLTTFSDNYSWRFYGALNPLNFLEGEQVDPGSFVAALNFDSKTDYDKYLSRLSKMPNKIQQYIARFKQAVRYKHTYHRVSIDKIPKQIDALLVTDITKSQFYTPFAGNLDNITIISGIEKRSLRQQATRAITNLQSAFVTLKNYIDRDYIFHTRLSYGLIGMAGGQENYKACLRWHISVDLTPEQVHQKGLEEIARIHGEIQKIMNKRNFNGTLAEFYKQLRENPAFHLHSKIALLNGYKHILYHRVYPQLPRVFKNIPPVNVTIVEMPYDGPEAMYVGGADDASHPGVYQVNLKRPDAMLKTHEDVSFARQHLINQGTCTACAFSERLSSLPLVSNRRPGSGAIYAHAAKLPDFQKYIEYSKYFEVPYHFPFYTAYTEGWALYAESLGEYLGLYKDDNELLGRYGWEIFRACRLVVDTGIHYFGWTRGRAIKYMVDHTPMARSDVEIEIDRYITWPGQACAYKIGELKIKELRQKAMTKLGTAFDIRDFHSVILDHGPVPLHLLDRIVQSWIDEVLTRTWIHKVSQNTTAPPTHLPFIPNIFG